MKIWRMQQLTIAEGKILIFKTLAISQILHLLVVRDVIKHNDLIR